MKKIAVYFSGRCHGYELCLEKLSRHFYGKYDVDFFWSIDEESETPYYAEFRRLLKPKGVYYEKVDKKIIDVPISSLETRQRNTLSMFFHNYHCGQMIMKYIEATGQQYHAVVRFRAEIDSDTDLVIDEKLLEHTVYIPHGYNYRGISDRIAYGTLSSMIVYSSLYVNIPNYVFAKQAIFNPEYLLMFHLNENNMSVIRFPYHFTLHPGRHKVRASLVESQDLSTSVE